MTRLLRGGGRCARNPFRCARNDVEGGAVVLVGYKVNGIGTTTNAMRLVHAFRPSYIVDANMTKNVSDYLGVVSIIIDQRIMCRSM